MARKKCDVESSDPISPHLPSLLSFCPQCLTSSTFSTSSSPTHLCLLEILAPPQILSQNLLIAQFCDIASLYFSVSLKHSFLYFPENKVTLDHNMTIQIKKSTMTTLSPRPHAHFSNYPNNLFFLFWSSSQSRLISCIY